MNLKYLAYTIVLAGWLLFSYWLYSTEIYPRFHPGAEIEWPVHVKDLNLPLAFNWGSDLGLAGQGFKAWVEEIRKIDSSDNLMVVRAIYFQDEMSSPEDGKELGLNRAKLMIEYLQLDPAKISVEIVQREINADVRSKPFSALEFETLNLPDVLVSSQDTLEVCFPLKDSLTLPIDLIEALDDWLAGREYRQADTTYLVGIADGTGIAESSDMAMDRAILVKNRMAAQGWDEGRILVSTDQRNLPQHIKNRCVVVYFEKG